MARRDAKIVGGYLGIALLASMITFAVMLVLFTDPGPAMRIEVGYPLRQACDVEITGGAAVCYAVEVVNVGDGAGSFSCNLSDPSGAHATFPNGAVSGNSDQIAPHDSTTLMIRLDLYDGVEIAEVSPPGLECEPL